MDHADPVITSPTLICAIMKKLGNGDNVPPPDRCTFSTQSVNAFG